MLISPEDVRAYTVFESVKNRSDELLISDIIEAEAEVFKIVVGESLRKVSHTADGVILNPSRDPKVCLF